MQGDIDYNRATVTARVAVQLTPLSGYRKAMAAVIAALHKTGKSVEWGWGTWPGEIEFRGAGAMRATYFINYENIFNPQMPGPTTGGTRSEFLVADIGRRYREQHFIDSEIAAFGKVVTVRAVLQNEQGEAIARAEQRLRFAVAYRDSVAAAGPGSARPRPSTGIIFAPLAIPEWFIFHGVKAADLSGSTAFRVISIDGVPLASHAGDYVVIRTETIKR